MYQSIVIVRGERSSLPSHAPFVVATSDSLRESQTALQLHMRQCFMIACTASALRTALCLSRSPPRHARPTRAERAALLLSALSSFSLFLFTASRLETSFNRPLHSFNTSLDLCSVPCHALAVVWRPPPHLDLLHSSLAQHSSRSPSFMLL